MASGRLSIRIRLTALAVLVVGAGLAAGSLLILGLVRQDLLRNAERAALQQARDTAALVAAGHLDAVLRDRLVQVVGGDGTVVAASPQLEGMPPLLEVWPRGSTPTSHTLRSSRIGEGGDFTVVAAATRLGDTPVVLYTASSLEAVADATEATSSALLVAVPAVLAASGWACWLLIGRTLHPVERMRRQLAAIGASELSRRIPEPNTRDELGRLASTMNQMLERLDEAHQRLQRFTADAAHELRSPLTAILTSLEVALAHPRRTDWVPLAQQLHLESRRLHDLTDELLLLSRGEQEPLRESVDLDELVLQEVQALRARGKVSVDLSALSAVRLTGHPDGLRRVIRNLLDNAERHARTTVSVRLVADGDTAELVVADDGDGIPPAERDRVFDRFYRRQPARDRGSGGAGLGLAIARTIATAHGGQLGVTDSDRGARLLLRIPLTPGAGSREHLGHDAG